MRSRRVVVKEVDSIYHCMSRTVNGEKIFGPEHLRTFQNILARAAAFSGVDVITYCFMSNHFHVLVRVPGVDQPSDAELVRRFRSLYPKPGPYQPMSAERLEDVLRAGGSDASRLRKALLSRMGDISEFMKTLKQRFSVWFNGVHRRFGPLWSDRFKSVLVEGDGYSLKTVAAYIDLNPVRAGIVADPKDYPYSGYGKAVLGGIFERSGIQMLGGGGSMSLGDYKSVLFGKGGLSADGCAGDGSGMQPGESVSREPPSSKLLRPIRHFTNGKILGSQDFVKRILDEYELFRDVVIRRRSPIDVPAVQSLYSGTSVRRPRRSTKESVSSGKN